MILTRDLKELSAKRMFSYSCHFSMIAKKSRIKLFLEKVY